MSDTTDLTGGFSGVNTLVSPLKGTTNWDEDIKQNFQKITDHDHTATKGNQITNDAITDNHIQVEKKKVYILSLGASATVPLSEFNTKAAALSTNKLFIIDYQITDGSNNCQVGKLMGKVGSYVSDEFTGDDLGVFSFSSTTLQVTAQYSSGSPTNNVQYSIEFLE